VSVGNTWYIALRKATPPYHHTLYTRLTLVL